MQRPNARLLRGVLVLSVGLLVLMYLTSVSKDTHNDAIDKELVALINRPVSASSGRIPWVASSESLRPLVAAGRFDVPYLIKRLGDGDLRVRMYSACALGEIGDSRAAEPLMALLEEMQAGTNGLRGWLYSQWTSMGEELRWRYSVEEAAIDAMKKVRDPAISAYALKKLLAELSSEQTGKGTDFWGGGAYRTSYCRLLEAQGMPADIRRAVDALQARRRKAGPDASINADIQLLQEAIQGEKGGRREEGKAPEFERSKTQ